MLCMVPLPMRVAHGEDERRAELKAILLPKRY
jgi:hypothetical protein